MSVAELEGLSSFKLGLDEVVGSSFLRLCNLWLRIFLSNIILIVKVRK